MRYFGGNLEFRDKSRLNQPPPEAGVSRSAGAAGVDLSRLEPEAFSIGDVTLVTLVTLV